MKNNEEAKKRSKRLMVVFGGMGDLSMDKVLPGLYGLHQIGAWGPEPTLLLVDRKVMAEREARRRFKEAVSAKGLQSAFDEKIMDRIKYCAFDMENAAGYERLGKLGEDLFGKDADSVEMLFFMAVPPTLYGPIAKGLGRLGWNREAPAWKRLIVEKPFGSGLSTARELNAVLKNCFEESQIYRIDHYLGKEMTQNIMVIRFANRIFEGLWSARFIDNIQITVSESKGIGTRGGYYDKSGAIKDMVQSHMLQLLALMAMDKPSCGLDETLRVERVNILTRLHAYGAAEIENHCVVGQYSASAAGKAYREEPGINPGSLTETYAALKVTLDHEAWKGVPFYLRTGKSLGEKMAYIAVEFKDSCSNFKDYQDLGGKNLLMILIQPEEGVYLKFNIKRPGREKVIMPVGMKFCQSCAFGPEESLMAYESLILDAMEGSRERFTRWEEIEAAWIFIDSIVSRLDRESRLVFYEAGGSGPDEARMLLERDGRKWWDVEEINS